MRRLCRRRPRRTAAGARGRGQLGFGRVVAPSDDAVAPHLQWPRGATAAAAGASHPLSSPLIMLWAAVAATRASLATASSSDHRGHLTTTVSSFPHSPLLPTQRTATTPIPRRRSFLPLRGDGPHHQATCRYPTPPSTLVGPTREGKVPGGGAGLGSHWDDWAVGLRREGRRCPWRRRSAPSPPPFRSLITVTALPLLHLAA